MRDRLEPVTTFSSQHPDQGLLRALLRQGAAITVAHTFFEHALPPRVGDPAPLPRRPRCILDAGHAGRVLAVANRDRGVLPRWGINSPIRDRGAEPGQYTGTVGWTSRQHYLEVVVPAAIARQADVLKKHHVAGDTFQRWAEAKSLYAQERRSGRRVIVRPVTLAGLLQCDKRTVQRCQAAAREMDLEVVITPGRMLSEFEAYAARRRGSPQRGLSTVSAFVVPPPLRHFVGHVTPSCGLSLGASVRDIRTFQQRSARSKGAPLRSAPPQRTRFDGPLPRNNPPAAQKRPSERRTARRARQGPAWNLAVALTQQAIFLRRCPPGRIVGQLSRFTDPGRTGGRRWTTKQVLDAIAAVNRRLGYTAPVKAKTVPWALLAWYLGQIDPFADHPANQEPVLRPWCGQCASDTFRWLEDPTTRDPVRPCPRCSHQSRAADG